MGLKRIYKSGLLISALVFATLVATLLTAVPSRAVQSVPYQMNFQGRLNDSTGAPMPNGTYNMKFRIYSGLTGGSALWTEQRAVSASTGVTVTTGGLFSVQLGAVTSLPSNIFNSSSPLYLEVELPTPGTATCGSASCESYTEGPMSPRNPMVSSPFAINSDLLDGLDSSAFALASGSAGYIQNGTSAQTANFNITGTGTIGGAFVVNNTSLVKTNLATAFAVQNTSARNLLLANTQDTALTLGSSSDWLQGATKLTDPATLPNSNTNGTAWSADGTYVAAVSNSSPYLYVYKRSGDTFTKLANPATLPAGTVQSVAWSADGTYLAVGVGSAPRLVIYKRSGDTFTKLSDPATLPTDIVRSVRFSPDGNYLTVGSQASPYVFNYKRSGDTFTLLSNPATLPAGTVQSATWSPDSIYLAVGSTGNPRVVIYKRSGDTFTKLTNPASLPDTTVNTVAFSPDGTYLVAGDTSSSTRMFIYKRSGDTFTKLSDPANLPTGIIYAADWSPDGTFLAVGSSDSPYVRLYQRSGDTFTKLSDLTTSPGATVYGTAFSPDGSYLTVAGTGTPKFIIYKVNNIAATVQLSGNIQMTNGFTSSGSAQLLGGLIATTAKFQNTNDSTSAFTIANASGDSLLTADTSNNRITIASDLTVTGKLVSGDLSVSAGNSITLAGGNTGSRPGSPTAGMMYFDTSTGQLLTYNGSKWVGSQKAAVIVAASNSSQAAKDAADYVATGSNDGATINSALTAAAGGTVYLQAGTYILGATSISVPNNTILAGAGDGTVLTYANSLASGTYYAITNTDTSTGAGVTIRDLTIDGNKANQSAASTWGIYLNGMGSTTRSGSTVENTTIKNLYNNEAIYLTNSSSNTITGNQIYSNGKALSLANSSSGNTVANNTLTGNGGNGALSTDGLSGTNTITGNTTSDSTIGMYINSSSNTITGNTANTNAMAGIYLAGGGNTVTSNTTRGNGIGIYVVAAGNTVTSNIVSSSNGDGISIYSSNNIISSNRIQDSGSGVGMDWSNGITVSGNSNQVVDNQITDTAGAGFAMSIFGTNNYLSNNTFSGTGATSINDGGTNTIYSGQMKSATGDLTFRVGADSATAFSFQNAAGTSILTADTSASQLKINASTLVTTNSTTALKIQNTSNTSLFQVDTSAMQVVVGTTTNGITFTSNGMTYTGTARPSNQVTLSAEYSGATFTGDGTNNNGTLGSDFCSGSSRLNINPMSPGTNPCAATNTYNYYQWTTSQATAQDYDIYVRYQIPSDYDAGSLSNLAITGWGTTTGEQVTIALFSDASGSACSTSSNAISAATTWQQATVASPLGSCTIAAGDTVTFRVHLQAGQGNYARSGPITFTYKKKF